MSSFLIYPTTKVMKLYPKLWNRSKDKVDVGKSEPHWLKEVARTDVVLMLCFLIS